MRSLLRAIPPALLVACSVNLDVPDGTIVSCTSNADCPESARCNPLRNACDFNTGDAAPAIAFTSTGDASGRSAALVPFSFDALDANAPPVGSDTVRFSVEYSRDGATWCTATIVDEPPAIGAEATHVTLTWDALTDATSGNACPLVVTALIAAADDGAVSAPALAYDPGIQLRVTATDSTNQSSDLASSAFAVGNDAPLFAFEDDGAVLRQQSPLEYGLTDSSSDVSTLDVQFQIDGETTWHVASLRGSVSGLVADPLGAATSRFVVWNADAPLLADPSAPSGIGHTNRHITMRGRAVENVLAGVTTYGPWATITRDVRNQTAPVVGSLAAYAIEPGYASSLVLLQYQVFDAEDDLVDISVQFAANDSTTQHTATPYPSVRHSGTRSLAASAGNSPIFTFVWDVAADLSRRTSGIAVSVTAADDGAIGSTATTTLSFDVGTDPFFATPTTANLAETESRRLELEIADFNGDHVDDFIVLESARLEVFIASVTTKLPTTPSRALTLDGKLRGLRVGDFNEDGRADALVYGQSDGIAIVFGATSGIASQAQTQLVGYGTDADYLSIGDFNADGHVDLATGDPPYIDISKGHGDGTFEAPVHVDGGNVLFALAGGDFNGDGCDDLAYAVQVGSGIKSGNGDTYAVTVEARVRWGAASGAIVDGTSYTVAAQLLGIHNNGTSGTDGWYVGLAAADIGGDRDALFVADLEQSNGGRLQMLTYDGAFEVAATLHGTADVGYVHRRHNQQGDYIVTAPRDMPDSTTVALAYRWNTAESRIEKISPSSATLVADLVIANLSGPDKQDLIAVTTTQLVTTLTRTPVIAFDASQNLARSIAERVGYIAAGDIDGDELADVLVCDNTQFANHTVLPYAAALSADAKTPTCGLDVGGSSAFLIVDGAYDSNASDPMTIGDFDGDGGSDILTNANSLYVLTSADAPFAFDPVRLVSGVGSVDGPRGVGDFDNDGRDDTAYAYQSGSHSLEIDYASGAAGSFSNFAVTTLTNGTTYPQAGATIAGDIDNDGIDDIAVLRSSSIDVFFGAQGGSVSSACSLTVPASVGVIGDIDNDGGHELVIGTSSGIVGYTVTRCAAVAGPTVAGNYSSLALRDVNGDGRMDLVGKTSTGTSVLTGTSTGLAAPAALDITTGAFSFGDMNGDRLPELFVASSSGTMSWQLNRRFADGNAWHVDIDAAHVIGGTIPSTDRFGGTWTLPIGMRRTVDQPLGVRQLEDGRRDFTDSLRHSGVATTLPSTALAVTDTWELTGDIATRIASESGDYEVTSMLTVLGAPDLVFDFPVDVARFGAIDASHVRVFARLVSDYQRDGTASTLPRTPEGGMKLTPVSNWIEVTPDSDGDLTSGSGPRFTVAADSTAIHVATPTLGVFRAYEIP